MRIGTGAFRWLQHYRMQGTTLNEHLEEAIAAAAGAGCQLWEPLGLETEEEARRLDAALKLHRMQMESLYLNCRLHEETWPEAVEMAVRSARLAKKLGAKFICVNPEPVDWRQPVDKTDDQLSIQLGAMFSLCQELRSEGMRLAYHIHSPEMRRNGREFCFMLDNLPAELMDFCLDAHWIYRGAGNRQQAVNQALEKYGSRIISVHLRQSINGIWTETLGEGDLDHTPIAAALGQNGYSGPLYVELGYEEGVPQTISLEEAHRRSVEWVRETFSGTSQPN